MKSGAPVHAAVPDCQLHWGTGDVSDMTLHRLYSQMIDISKGSTGTYTVDRWRDDAMQLREVQHINWNMNQRGCLPRYQHVCGMRPEIVMRMFSQLWG